MFSINKILDCCYTAVSDSNYPFIKAAENFPKRFQAVLLLKKAAAILISAAFITNKLYHPALNVSAVPVFLL